jgi:hypothetical protein
MHIIPRQRDEMKKNYMNMFPNIGALLIAGCFAFLSSPAAAKLSSLFTEPDRGVSESTQNIEIQQGGGGQGGAPSVLDLLTSNPDEESPESAPRGPQCGSGEYPCGGECCAASMCQNGTCVRPQPVDTSEGIAAGNTTEDKRNAILGVKKQRSELLAGSTANALNKTTAIGGAVTGVTSTITSGAGAFATDFGSMKSKIDACLNSLNISQN